MDPATLEQLSARVCAMTGADAATPGVRVQELWSGYGEIRRFALLGAGLPQQVIVKYVRPPAKGGRHPRGWNSEFSHQRKLRSYQVETGFYLDYASRCAVGCRVPRALSAESDADGWLLVLEDLDAAGFPGRRADASDAEMLACLGWLAAFHATFLGVAPRGLWPVGTYWHLATRPDELAALDDAALRAAAPRLDALLSGGRYRSLVHGDAKLANFCFGAGAGAVAAVDFQYVGGGCGVKDVVGLLASGLDGEACEREAGRLVDAYFEMLRVALRDRQVDVAALEAEWRALVPVAWADLVRFLAGWAPEHVRLHDYSLAQTRAALARL